MKLHNYGFGVVMVELQQAKRLIAWHFSDKGNRDLCIPLKGHGNNREVINPLPKVFDILKDIMLHILIHTKTILEPAR